MTLQPSNGPGTQQTAAEPRLDVLMSPAVFPEPQLLEIAEQNPDWNILLDSGAFTNFTTGKDVITLDWFGGFLGEHGHRFFRYFNLDVIGDHTASMARLLALQKLGLDPIPVFQRGGTIEDLNGLLDNHEIIAVGGIAGVLNRTEDRKYLHEVMACVGDRRKQVHLLGVSQLPVVSMYRPWSVDSASVGRGRMFGSLDLWDGQRWTRINRRIRGGKDPYRDIRPNQRTARVLASYDLTFADLGTEDGWKQGGKVLFAGMRGWVRYARFVRRSLGVRLFLVDNPRQGHHEELAAAWAMEKARMEDAA